jgi:hypothetical protein
MFTRILTPSVVFRAPRLREDTASRSKHRPARGRGERKPTASRRAAGLLAAFLACAAATPAAWADTITPTWTASVYWSGYSLDTGQVGSGSAGGGGFTVWSYLGFPPYDYVAGELVDYQNIPGPTTVWVTNAWWDSDFTGQQTVPLEVGTVPASPQVPSGGTYNGSPWSAGGVAGASLSPGSQLTPITLDATPGSDVCFLFTSLGAVNYLRYGGTHVTVQSSVVPEPSSIVILGLGIAAVAVACASGRVRRRVFRKSTAASN